MQKDAIDRATQDGKVVITATQMLESMINSPEPTRAEATDVANAVIDGTSAVMLSAETSVGSYPVLAVRAMAEIAHAAEEYPGHPRPRARRQPRRRRRRRSCTPRSTWPTQISAAALVVPTSTGGGARACAKYRPPRPIVALAHEPARRQSADARVGRAPRPRRDGRLGRDDDRGRAARAASAWPRLRPAPRCPHRRPQDRDAGRHEPDHGARDPVADRAARDMGSGSFAP